MITVDKILNNLNKQRYFLVSFSLKEKLAFGNILLSCENFPSYNYLLKEINKIDNWINNVVILNIFEFKNKEDYNNYKNE